MVVPTWSHFLGKRASCCFLILVVLNLLKERCWDDTKVLIAFEIQVLSGEGRKLSSDTKVKQNIFYFYSVNDSNLLMPFNIFSLFPNNLSFLSLRRHERFQCFWISVNLCRLKLLVERNLSQVAGQLTRKVQSKGSLLAPLGPEAHPQPPQACVDRRAGHRGPSLAQTLQSRKSCRSERASRTDSAERVVGWPDLSLPLADRKPYPTITLPFSKHL